MLEAAIEAVHLGRKFDNVWGLRDASFLAKNHELTVLVGPNGAGKTTTIRILTTVLKPSKGHARVLGMDVLKDYEKIRRRIAYLPQDYSVPWDVTPEEYITWNLVIRGWSLYDAKDKAREWLNLFEISNIKDKPCRTLSGGERRRVAVAAALATNADVIFLDEPTAGLDPEIKQVVWRSIREIVSSGASILLTTHDMREAQILADKVVLINNGVTVIEGEPKELINSLPYKYKIVIGKSKFINLDDLGSFIDLGDRVILYTKTRREAINLVEEIDPNVKIHSMGYVELEDAYLYLITKGENFGSSNEN